MPAWWRKSRAKAKPETEALEKKEKARSFDEAAVAGREGITNGSNISSSNSPRGGSGSLFSFESDVERKVVVCHPLPRPMISSSVSLPHHESGGSAGASASVSSVSSSGSSDETTDLANYRVSEAVVIPRGRTPVHDSQRQHQYVAEDRKPFSGSPIREFTERPVSFPVSPRRDLQTSNGSMYFNETIFSPGSRSPANFPVSPRRDLQTSNGSTYSNETIFSPGSRSPGPRSSGCVLSSSPVSSRVFTTGPQSPVGKHDDVRSPSHPLPLPPGSPTSPASRSLQSKWKKGKLLGRGTFGHVYAGFNSESGQMCAIKEVEVISDDANSKECLKQLAQEINLLSQLSHPNIVQYYGSELVDDRLSVYLEYVSGGSIHKLLQEYGPFGEPVIQSYAGQILSGLAYLHGRNTIHRDIKGANILVDPNGEIKLADFGMAKHISSYTSIRSFKGSPYWMAPEVIMNTTGYTLSVDIWSLGCTIIEMASAKPPWSNYTGVQAIFKIGNSKDIPEIPEHLSREGKSFLKHCLQRDPALRPTAVKLMDHPFVRDQAKLKISHGSVIREAYPSSSDGCRSPTASDFASNNRTASNYAYNRQPGNDSAYNRSISPLQSRAIINTLGCSPVSKTPSDLTGLRVNMSLPVSPCSSPLRQFRQSNWSCLPSPSHPLGANNYGLSNNLSYPSGYSSRYTDHPPELSLPSGLSMYGSPRT